MQLICIALVAAAAGALAGYLAQQGLLTLLKGMIAAELPAPSLRPLWMGFAAALLLLTGCALPPILQLARVPAIRVLRRDIGPPPLTTLLAYGPAALVIALLIQWVSGGGWLSVGFIAGLALAIGVLALAGWLLVTLVGRLRAGTGIAWRYGAANLARRRGESIVQIVALGLGLSALLLLTIVRGDLVEDWRARLPANPPNYFFVNIPDTERAAFSELLTSQGAKLSRMSPMIRGRLLAINDVPVAGRHFRDGQGEGFASREQNLSWSDEIGTGNRITAGHWFTPAEHGQPLVSVAINFQQSMDLKLGDKLTFDVAGETVPVTISSFRNVQWDSMQPNFFLMFAPGLLDGAAGTWMASAAYRPQDPARVADVVRRFPSVSIFDVDQLIAQVRSIIDKAVMAVQSVFLFTLLAGSRGAAGRGAGPRAMNAVTRARCCARWGRRGVLCWPAYCWNSRCSDSLRVSSRPLLRPAGVISSRHGCWRFRIAPTRCCGSPVRSPVRCSSVLRAGSLRARIESAADADPAPGLKPKSLREFSEPS